MDNYPDTIYEADPDAPWNQQDLWTGRRCDECMQFYEVPSSIRRGATEGFCVENREYVDGKDEACEWFEE